MILQNDISEKASRWGAKTVEGSGHQEHFSVEKLRQEALAADKIMQVLLLYCLYYSAEVSTV